ncbi:hypothetical protein ACFWG5_09150 [Streptomyces hydrogenans]
MLTEPFVAVLPAPHPLAALRHEPPTGPGRSRPSSGRTAGEC